MKRIVFFLLLAVLAQSINAQNVGIGTTTPNAKAQLDISSTTKGVLIPRMTTAQRTAITIPPNGLMVYDTDKDEFYHYNGTSWRAILNDGYWTRGIATRERIGNAFDSVGVGTFTPAERFQVNGNQQIQNALPLIKLKTTTSLIPLQEAGIEFNNNSGNLAKILYTNQSLVLSGQGTTGIFNDLVLKNGNMGVGGVTDPSERLHLLGNMIVNFIDPTIQFQRSAVDKGFIQLSGDNLRLGTYSTNTNGRCIIRVGGSDRMTVFADGTISIGTTSTAAGYKLNIGGKAICEELKVQLVSNWPDYVFKKSYKLKTIEELNSFIQLNGHLPDIPAAKEIEKNGLEVGDMQKRMMQKIEELTLYVIQLKQEIDTLKNK